MSKEPPPPRDLRHHLTPVRKSVHKYMTKYDPEERKAFMRGGGALQRLHKARAIATELSRQLIAEFCVERDAVLRSMDPGAMVLFMQKHRQPVPANWSRPNVPLAIMHKARLQIRSFTPEEKEYSKTWLLVNGYTEHIDPRATNAVEEAMMQGVFIRDIPPPPKPGAAPPAAPKPEQGQTPSPPTPRKPGEPL